MLEYAAPKATFVPVREEQQLFPDQHIAKLYAEVRILSLHTLPYNSHRDWSGVVVKACATSRKVQGSIPGGVTGDFFRGIRQFHESEVDSA
jgi:hypothetical protein